jgi:hypothetical protein
LAVGNFRGSCRQFFVRVLNCYSTVSVECRVAAVPLRVRDSFLPEVLLSGCRQTLWRLSVGPVACFSCQSSLAVAVGDFWRLWGCRLGGFGAVGDFWRIWGCRRGGFGAVVDLGGSRRLGCRGFGLSAISGGLGAVDVKDFVKLVNLKDAWCVVAGIGLAGLAEWTCYSGGLLRGLAWLGPGYFLAAV